MKIHRINKKTNRPLCQKRFNVVNAQNYEQIEDQRFFEIANSQTDYVCKKCLKIKINEKHNQNSSR